MFIGIGSHGSSFGCGGFGVMKTTWPASLAGVFWAAIFCVAAPVAAGVPAHFTRAQQDGPRVPQGVSREHFHQGDWRLDISRDRFSGAIACRLRAHGGRQIFRAGAVGFAVGAPDMSRAAYRIDGGDPVAARGDVQQLIAQHVPMERGGMDDPSGGYVWIPFDKLDKARWVAIEPRPGARPKVERLTGMTALHDLALTHGCSPDGVFVEQ